MITKTGLAVVCSNRGNLLARSLALNYVLFHIYFYILYVYFILQICILHYVILYMFTVQ